MSCDTHLLVDTQQGNAVLLTLAVGLREWVLGLVLTLAVHGDGIACDTFRVEVNLVDAFADLNRELKERESLSRLDEDDLVAFMFAFVDGVLQVVSEDVAIDYAMRL